MSSNGIENLNYIIEGWKRKNSKCYWIKKQIECFHIHPSLCSTLRSLTIK